MLYPDVISLFAIRKFQNIQKIDENRKKVGEESPHIFQKTSGMSLKFSGTPSPPPPHTAFSGLNR